MKSHILALVAILLLAVSSNAQDAVQPADSVVLPIPIGPTGENTFQFHSATLYGPESLAMSQFFQAYLAFHHDLANAKAGDREVPAKLANAVGPTLRHLIRAELKKSNATPEMTLCAKQMLCETRTELGKSLALWLLDEMRVDQLPQFAKRAFGPYDFWTRNDCKANGKEFMVILVNEFSGEVHFQFCLRNTGLSKTDGKANYEMELALPQTMCEMNNYRCTMFRGWRWSGGHLGRLAVASFDCYLGHSFALRVDVGRTTFSGNETSIPELIVYLTWYPTECTSLFVGCDLIGGCLTYGGNRMSDN